VSAGAPEGSPPVRFHPAAGGSRTLAQRTSTRPPRAREATRESTDRASGSAISGRRPPPESTGPDLVVDPGQVERNAEIPGASKLHDVPSTASNVIPKSERTRGMWGPLPAERPRVAGADEGCPRHEASPQSRSEFPSTPPQGPVGTVPRPRLNFGLRPAGGGDDYRTIITSSSGSLGGPGRLASQRIT
jgi:hypothetical protein